jgi:hypothetical protein
MVPVPPPDIGAWSHDRLPKKATPEMYGNESTAVDNGPAAARCGAV